MNIHQPIFIVGAGRSGSTVFHRIFSKHPNVAWLSNLCNRFPNKPYINRYLMQIIDFPVAGSLLQKKFIPDEAYNFWDHYSKGFRHTCRDLYPMDVTRKIKQDVTNAMKEVLTSRRNRLLIKITGWSRIGFLSNLFPDAKFIHLIRDGRAVANSLINVAWWAGWKGPQNWRWGMLTPSRENEWETYNKSFIALAALEWKILVEAVEVARTHINDDNFLEVKYENLCSNPLGFFKEVFEFSQLDMTMGFQDTVKNYPLKNTNYKWQSDLTEDQQKILEDLLSNFLIKYNYL